MGGQTHGERIQQLQRQLRQKRDKLMALNTTIQIEKEADKR
jgi:hypothetical protein